LYNSFDIPVRYSKLREPTRNDNLPSSIASHGGPFRGSFGGHRLHLRVRLHGSLRQSQFVVCFRRIESGRKSKSWEDTVHVKPDHIDLREPRFPRGSGVFRFRISFKINPLQNTKGRTGPSPQHPEKKEIRPRRPPETDPDERDPDRSRDRGTPAANTSLSANPGAVKPDEAKHSARPTDHYASFRKRTIDTSRRTKPMAVFRYPKRPKASPGRCA
jgi:hypothetical protein